MKMKPKAFSLICFLLFISGGFAQNKDFHPWCLALIHGAVFIHECSLNGKLFRLSIMYELITCFHEFCTYEYTKKKITKFYLVVYFSPRYNFRIEIKLFNCLQTCCVWGGCVGDRRSKFGLSTGVHVFSIFTCIHIS